MHIKVKRLVLLLEIKLCLLSWKIDTSHPFRKTKISSVLKFMLLAFPAKMATVVALESKCQHDDSIMIGSEPAMYRITQFELLSVADIEFMMIILQVNSTSFIVVLTSLQP